MLKNPGSKGVTWDTSAQFSAGDAVLPQLLKEKILVIGAGGLGCELLKNLALSGFTDIHVIDMDTIDLSNLNRQFLFRPVDVGKAKSETAAAFINQRVAGCTVTPYIGKIQDMTGGADGSTVGFYKQFKLVIAGLDALEPRRWLNSTLCAMAPVNEDGELTAMPIPLIDGGTEGFKGQARVIYPMATACFECTLDMFPPQVNFPLCTIAETPRLPEHCVEWASVLEWSRVQADGTHPFPDEKINGDNPEHLKWLFDKALARATEHSIEGVTYMLTMGVVKNIIPAVASTNAVIAAACAQEAFKFATMCCLSLDNYMMFNGTDGLYCATVKHERNPECAVCSIKPVSLDFTPTETLGTLIEALTEKLQLTAPSLRASGKTLRMATGALERATRGNLDKSCGELQLSNGQELSCTDQTLGTRTVLITLSDTTGAAQPEAKAGGASARGLDTVHFQ